MDVMKQAENYIKINHSDKYEILGGFISPSHPSIINVKLAEHALPWSTRNYLI